MNTQKLEQVPIDKLVPYARNARTHSKEQIAQLRASLREFGFVSPAVIDADYNILVGHGRITAAREEGYETVEKLMDGKNANLVLTDPPYGVSFKASDGLTIQNDSLKGEEFYKFLLAAFKNMADHLEKCGAAYCFHADTEGLTFRKAFIDAGFHLAGVCIWVKNSLVLGRSDYQWQHEPVLYGFLQNGKHPWYSDRKQTTIWNYDNRYGSRRYRQPHGELGQRLRPECHLRHRPCAEGGGLIWMKR